MRFDISKFAKIRLFPISLKEVFYKPSPERNVFKCLGHTLNYFFTNIVLWNFDILLNVFIGQFLIKKM